MAQTPEGGEILIMHGPAGVRPKGAQCIDVRGWKWKSIIAAKWNRHEHINALELRAEGSNGAADQLLVTIHSKYTPRLTTGSQCQLLRKAVAVHTGSDILIRILAANQLGGNVWPLVRFTHSHILGRRFHLKATHLKKASPLARWTPVPA